MKLKPRYVLLAVITAVLMLVAYPGTFVYLIMTKSKLEIVNTDGLPIQSIKVNGERRHLWMYRIIFYDRSKATKLSITTSKTSECYIDPEMGEVYVYIHRDGSISASN